MKAFLLSFSLLVSFVGFAQEDEKLPCPDQGDFYSAEFNLMGNKMKGFLAVKRKRNHVLHVAFTSPMGNNLLEMRWKKGRWKKIFSIKKLGSKRMFEMLSEDILLLFGYFQYDRSFEDLGNEWRWNGKKLFPTFDEEGKPVSLKVIAKRHRPSKTVKYRHEGFCMSQISIHHQGFPFSIVLEPLKKK